MWHSIKYIPVCMYSYQKLITWFLVHSLNWTICVWLESGRGEEASAGHANLNNYIIVMMSQATEVM